MKKQLSLLALAFVSVATLPVHAATATATGNFNVNITLTSKCEINNTTGATGPLITELAMSYQSFQTTASSGSTTFNVRCTNTLPFSLALDSATLVDGSTGLNYLLALSASATAPTTFSATASLAGQVGTGSNVSYYVYGNIASGQAGTSTDGTPNKQRTLTISY